ncbi:MAG TPA: hypothetical protein VHC67_09515 [Gaiellaceae bacterium]|jgi:hypothetical protein|nr:hypothetical protein [Gaiellaceae bacterium]
MTADPILREARALVAAGGTPDWKALRDRIRALGLGTAPEREALRRLERVGAVHRARATVRPKAAEAAPAPSPAPGLRSALLRTRPTVTGNMDVRREGDALVWPPERAVAAWELRISERPDPRGDYVVREEGELPGETTRLELPLGEVPLRVHLLGRDRGGRLVRRTILSGISRETWTDRWQRRASAS